MLKNIDPVLGPDILAVLRAMGHGDEIVIADANFPAASIGRKLLRLDGVSAPRAVRAVLSVLPLDSFVPHAAFRMAVVDNPSEMPPIVREFSTLLAESGYSNGIEAIERFAFYERAKCAYAVIATGELRYWGNLILKKGTIAPDGKQSFA
jgi:L-fucose mutarotase